MTTILLRRVDSRPTTCRSCGAPIRWAVTERGKKMPLNADADCKRASPSGSLQVDSFSVHFATCPNANAHRHDRRAPSERID